MPHLAATVTRFLARRALRGAGKRAVRELVDFRRQEGQLQELRIGTAGYSTSFAFPDRADSFGDLPL